MDIDKLFSEAIVIDACNPSNWDDPGVFQNLHEGGVTAINATIAVYENFLQEIAGITKWPDRFRTNSEHIIPIRSATDIRKAKIENRSGIILGWQNSTPIENELGRLELFHTLGVRIMQLTYNERNLLGTGCYEARDGGLSFFGREAVKEMNRLKILIDLSHVGDQTVIDTIEQSDQPVAFTHAGARSHYQHPRNHPDTALKLVAEKGGVVGTNAFPLFLPCQNHCTLDNYLDSLEVLIEKTGIDHVGLGIDFTYGHTKEFFDWLEKIQGTHTRSKEEKERASLNNFPFSKVKNLESATDIINIARGLADRGYSEVDIKKILGENFLRLFEEVWGE